MMIMMSRHWSVLHTHQHLCTFTSKQARKADSFCWVDDSRVTIYSLTRCLILYSISIFLCGFLSYFVFPHQQEMSSTEDLTEFEHQEQDFKDEVENVQVVKTSMDVDQGIPQNGESGGYDHRQQQVNFDDCVEYANSEAKDDSPQPFQEIQHGDCNEEVEMSNDYNENEFQNGGSHQEDHELTEARTSEVVDESTPDNECYENNSELHEQQHELLAWEERDEEQSLVEPVQEHEVEYPEINESQTECHGVEEDVDKEMVNYSKPDLLPTSETNGLSEADDCYDDADSYGATESDELMELNYPDKETSSYNLEDEIASDVHQQLSESFKNVCEPKILADVRRSAESEPFAARDDCDDDDVIPTGDQYTSVEEEVMSHQRHFDDVEPTPQVQWFDESLIESFEESVVENTPVKRDDVVRECDPVDDVTCLKKGFAKDLAGFWSSPKNESSVKQVKQPIELPRDDASSVVENNPQVLDGVVRSDDLVADDYVTVEQGRAKMMVNFFQNKKDDANVTKELKLDINFEEPGVYENSPREREGVIKSTDVVDDIRVQKGVIKFITNKFQSKEETNQKPREVIKIEPAKGPSIIENNPGPQLVDVVRSDSKMEDLPSLQGMTKSLVHKWKTNDLITSKSSTSKVDDVETILRAGMAAESGVFENQPSVRTDVAREDDEQADIISTQKTRSTRDLWNQKINQEGRAVEKSPQLIRFTPPRELSPARQPEENFTSFQQITLA